MPSPTARQEGFRLGRREMAAMNVLCNPIQGSAAYREVQGVIFDCDGVLIDSKEANRQYYNSIREMAGLGPMSLEEEDYVHAHSVHNSLRRILPAEKLEGLREKRSGMDYREFLQYITLQDGLLPLLSELQARGIRMAVSTNRTDTMDLILERFGLGHFFRPVITASRVCHAKPHPESVFRILEQWGMQASQVAYIGDTEVDQQTAQGAKVPFWAYKNAFLDASLHVSDFWALKRCFRGLGRRPHRA